MFTEDKKAIINGMTATDISLYCDMSGSVEKGPVSAKSQDTWQFTS